MDFPIHLYHQPQLDAVKINYETVDDMLPAKLDS